MTAYPVGSKVVSLWYYGSVAHVDLLPWSQVYTTQVALASGTVVKLQHSGRLVGWVILTRVLACILRILADYTAHGRRYLIPIW